MYEDRIKYINILNDCISRLCSRDAHNDILETILRSREAEWAVIFTSPAVSFPTVIESIALGRKWDEITSLFIFLVGADSLDKLSDWIMESVEWYGESTDNKGGMTHDTRPGNSSGVLGDNPRILLYYLARYLELPDV